VKAILTPPVIIIDRIETACMALATFPRRGTRRDDIRPGLRTVGFERRAIIAYQVKKSEVVIVRILYGGRDFEQILGSVVRRSERERR
jgi:toxin ParE1/3/4